MSNFDNMGKEELRAACKAAQVKGWGKMNNTQMRDALKAGQAAMGIPAEIKQTEAPVAAADPVLGFADATVQGDKPTLEEVSEQFPVEDSRKELTREDYVARGKLLDLTTLGVEGIDGHCPHCGIHLDNGWQTYEGIAEQNKQAAGQMKNHFVCLGCGGEFGPLIVRQDRKPVANPTGVKIEKNREERNGVKRPSVGTICHAIWQQLDNLRIGSSGGNYMPTFKDLKKLQEQYGWQRNTAVTQYQRWKEFNDLMVR